VLDRVGRKPLGRFAVAALLSSLLGGCGDAALPACVPAPIDAREVFVIDHGWHTDLAIPAAALQGRLAGFRAVFPGMRLLLVGFGRRTFMTAPVHGLADLLIGPFPGEGTLLIAGLTAPPDVAYDSGRMATLPLSADAARRLSDSVWNTLRLDPKGDPEGIGNGFFPGSRFYRSRVGYSGAYTCNSWTDDVLHRAGLMPGPAGIIFAGQVMARAGDLCAINPPAAD